MMLGMEYVLHYLVIGIVFTIIDGVWLVGVANKFYKQQLGDLLRPKPDLKPAVVFYLLYIFGVQVFALEPALRESSILEAVTHGALLGLLMYATYDLTNLSTLKKWPVRVVLVDMAWGAFLTGLTAGVAALLFN